MFAMPATSDILNDISESTISHLPSGRYVDLPADELRSGEYNDVCGCSDVLFENWQKEPLINGIRGFSPPSSLGNSSSASGTINLTVLPQRVSVPPPPVVSGCPSSFLPTARPDAPGQVAEILPEGEPSQIWLNTGEFVPCAEYEKIRAGSYRQKADRINANVIPILSDVQRAIFTQYGNVFGCNEKTSYSTCGKIIEKVMCSADQKHPSYYKHERCNDPLCPKCYTKFTYKIADNVVSRVQGYASAYSNDPIYHLIFWPDALSGYTNITDAFRNAGVMLKTMGAKMAVVWYHPYRIPDEIKEKLRRYKHANNLPPSTGFWKMAHDDVLGLGCLAAYVIPGPHFHAVVSGYLMDLKEYSKLNIGGYKKVRYLSNLADLESMTHYVSTHACKEAKKSTVRYFGMISYSKLARDDGTETIEDILCETCNARMDTHYCNDNDGEITVTGLKHVRATKKITIYKYWIRGKNPKTAKLTRHQKIWNVDPRSEVKP